MGLYGIGRAFNLKYRPNGPLKTFVYDRRMPIFDFGCRGCRGGYGGDYMSQSISYEYKPNAWQNFADFCYGLTAVFGSLGQLGIFGGGGKAEKADPKPQGANSGDELTALRSFGKAFGYTTIVKDPNADTYTAINPTTGDSISGDYNTVKTGILNSKKKAENEPVKKEEKPVEPKKEEKPEETTFKEGPLSAVNAGKIKGKDITIQDEARANSEIYGSVTDVGEPDKAHKNFPATISIKSQKHGNITATLQRIDTDTGDAIYKAGKESYRLQADSAGEIILTQHEDDTDLGASSKKGNWRNSKT